MARSRALVAALALMAGAACKDQTPTLTGDAYFPGGVRPVTLETFIPATRYLQPLGTYSGYETASSLGYIVAANQYQGALNAHGVEKFFIPKSITYSQGGNSLEDSLYSIRSVRLLALVDTAASRNVSTTLQAYPIAQKFDPATATWTIRYDSAGVQFPWATPGGTVGPILGQGTYVPGAGGADSVYATIDTARVSPLRNDTLGVLLATAPAGTRVQLRATILRIDVKPSNATRDTTITVDVNPSAVNTLFTPAPPAAGADFQAGGVFASRSLFRVNLDQRLPGCAPSAQPCDSVSIRDVRLNRVSLLLQTKPTPLGFDPLAPVPLELWLVSEPALGFRAPLVPSRVTGGPAQDSLATLARGAATAEIPFTAQAQSQINSDTLQIDLALLGQRTGNTSAARTFGVARFDPAPTLRVVYTLPIRATLP